MCVPPRIPSDCYDTCSIRPPLHHPNIHLVYVQIPDLFDALLLTVSGTSSHLHIWDPVNQKFAVRNVQGKEGGTIVIVGKDEVVSARSVTTLMCVASRPAYNPQSDPAIPHNWQSHATVRAIHGQSGVTVSFTLTRVRSPN